MMMKDYAKALAELPEWYGVQAMDEVKIATFGDAVILSHPSHPPIYWRDGKWSELKPVWTAIAATS